MSLVINVLNKMVNMNNEIDRCFVYEYILRFAKVCLLFLFCKYWHDIVLKIPCFWYYMILLF